MLQRSRLAPPAGDLHSRRRRLRIASRSRQGDAWAQQFHSPQQRGMLVHSPAAVVGRAVALSQTWDAEPRPPTRWSCRCSVSSCGRSRTSCTRAGQRAPAGAIHTHISSAAKQLYSVSIIIAITPSVRNFLINYLLALYIYYHAEAAEHRNKNTIDLIRYSILYMQTLCVQKLRNSQLSITLTHNRI